MQSLKNHYEKIVLAVMLVAFVASGVYWLAYLAKVRQIAEKQDLIGIQRVPKRLESLQAADFTATRRLASPGMAWGMVEGRSTGNLFTAANYMVCANRDCKFWLDAAIQTCPHCGTAQGDDSGPRTEPGLDSDGDGIPDEIENQHDFLNPHRYADAFLDQDGDWFTNLEEFRAGTDMADPRSRPALANRLRLVGMERDLFGIVVDSVMAVANKPKENWDISLRVREGTAWRSRFVKIGQQAGEYEVVDAEEKFEMVYDASLKSEVRRDVSTVTLRKHDGEPLVLVKGQRTFTGVVVDLVLEVAPGDSRRYRGIRSGDTLALKDSLGETESYLITVDGRNVKAALLRDGEPTETFLLDDKPKLVLPKQQAPEGQLPMFGPGAGIPHDMMYSPQPGVFGP